MQNFRPLFFFLINRTTNSVTDLRTTFTKLSNPVSGRGSSVLPLLVLITTSKIMITAIGFDIDVCLAYYWEGDALMLWHMVNLDMVI